jgi:hypothetical protein
MHTGRTTAAVAWLLVPLLDLIVLNTDCLPHVTESYERKTLSHSY